MRTVNYRGNERLVHYGDPNLPMRRNNPDRRKAFVTRHNCSGKTDPFAPGFWACYDWENTSEMTEASNFLFVELQELVKGKPFAGFAIGNFVDMFGREVEFKEKDHLEFATNTEAAIEAATTKGLPGLPIDARKHDKGDAAGWIIGVELGEVQDSTGKSIPALMLLAEWTKIGVELISEKIQTNFSPTVDLARKVLRGGSLTNWPASVDANGIPLFSAIELSEGVRVLQKPESPAADNVMEGVAISAPKQSNEDINMTENEMRDFIRVELQGALSDALKGAAQDGSEKGGDSQSFDITELLDLSGVVAKVQEAQKQAALEQFELAQQEAHREAMRYVAQVRKKANIAELCQRVTNGTSDVPYGLPVDSNDLEEFLGRLAPSDLEFATALLENIQANGRVGFAELGHGRKMVGTAQLPTEYGNILKSALESGMSVNDFFAANAAELGDAAQYDLSAYKEAK